MFLVFAGFWQRPASQEGTGPIEELSLVCILSAVKLVSVLEKPKRAESRSGRSRGSVCPEDLTVILERPGRLVAQKMLKSLLEEHLESKSNPEEK